MKYQHLLLLCLIFLLSTSRFAVAHCLGGDERYLSASPDLEWVWAGSVRNCVREIGQNAVLWRAFGHRSARGTKRISSAQSGSLVDKDAAISARAGTGSFVVPSRVQASGALEHSAFGVGPSAHGAMAGWKPLKIGAGGFVSGINIAPDGTKVIRTDTYGAYVWVESGWKQLLTTSSMPASDASLAVAGGVYEIAIAPSQTSTLYMLFNGYVYRSKNRGAIWSRTAFKQVARFDPNDNHTKGMGRFIAIDPANPDIVFVGTPSNGLWKSADGGTSWSRETMAGNGSVPHGGSQGGGHIISFDPSSSVKNGATQGIFVSTYGTGVYRSSDGGSSWTLTKSTPTTHRHMIVDQKGNVWLTDDTSSAQTPNLWKYVSGTWSHPTGSGANLSRGYSIAVDPADASHVYVSIDSGDLLISIDSGASWLGITFNRAIRTSSDVPWLAWTNEDYMTNGDIAFDPSGSNLLYMAEGIGVWHCNPPASLSTVRWQSQSAGIEQLVSNMVLAPPGGKPILLAWDRPVFYVNDPNVYPSSHGPNKLDKITMGWSADWASTSPETIVAIMNWWQSDVSGISRDGGQSWRRFAALPDEVPEKIGGSIAAASATNFVWVPSNHGNPWRTTDAGAHWAKISIPGVPVTGETGWGFSYFLNRQIVAADRVNTDTFYIYNSGPSGRAAVAGLYRSSDKGTTWRHVFTGEIANFSGYNAKLKSVPGQAGHLFFTSGPQSGPHPADTRFMRSSDGGVTWRPVGDFKEVYAFGFGAAYPGKRYPAIFIVGYNRTIWGIWRSIDNAASWDLIGDFPLGSFDQIKSIDGDKDKVGTVYIGFNGSGFAYKQ
jgi:photosystem II stability/assembly factor-like uncharacterized protein